MSCSLRRARRSFSAGRTETCNVGVLVKMDEQGQKFHRVSVRDGCRKHSILKVRSRSGYLSVQRAGQDSGACSISISS
jgi:hypothetical protein